MYIQEEGAGSVKRRGKYGFLKKESRVERIKQEGAQVPGAQD